MTATKRESASWVFGFVASIFAALAGFELYHNRYEIRGVVDAKILAIMQTIKNSQAGRLSSYETIPEEELTDFQKHRKTVLEYDIRDIEQLEQSMGLGEVPE